MHHIDQYSVGYGKTHFDWPTEIWTGHVQQPSTDEVLSTGQVTLQVAFGWLSGETLRSHGRLVCQGSRQFSACPHWDHSSSLSELFMLLAVRSVSSVSAYGVTVSLSGPIWM